MTLINKNLQSESVFSWVYKIQMWPKEEPIVLPIVKRMRPNKRVWIPTAVNGSLRGPIVE